jgi:hypothetical protein
VYYCSSVLKSIGETDAAARNLRKKLSTMCHQSKRVHALGWMELASEKLLGDDVKNTELTISQIQIEAMNGHVELEKYLSDMKNRNRTTGVVTLSF